LQNRSKTYPEQIWDVGQSHPGNCRPNRYQAPNQSSKDQKNIQHGQKIVLPNKLYWTKSQIKNNVQNKWQKNHKRNLAFEEQESNITKRNDDNRIEHGPNRAEKPGRWRPSWFD